MADSFASVALRIDKQYRDKEIIKTTKIMKDKDISVTKDQNS